MSEAIMAQGRYIMTVQSAVPDSTRKDIATLTRRFLIACEERKAITLLPGHVDHEENTMEFVLRSEDVSKDAFLSVMRGVKEETGVNLFVAKASDYYHAASSTDDPMQKVMDRAILQTAPPRFKSF
jgi:hypothetical protein